VLLQSSKWSNLKSKASTASTFSYTLKEPKKLLREDIAIPLKMASSFTSRPLGQGRGLLWAWPYQHSILFTDEKLQGAMWANKCHPFFVCL
jgi:hypothetical protein